MPAPKVDPETLVLRSRPPRAIRFRRGLIVGVAALGSASLIGLTWAALKPQFLTTAVQESELSAPSHQASADALAALPNNYGDVPKLGPPLPGDLGRPILRAERRGDLETASSVRQREDSERQAYADALKAARQSPVLVQAAGVATGARGGDAAISIPSLRGSDALPTAASALGEPLEGRSDGRGAINPHRLLPPSSPYILSAGSVIAASLLTALNSDVPGIVVAQVTQPVYDSATGRLLLVPQGSRLIGRYDEKLSFGANRLAIGWQRLILPDGSSLSLDDMPGTDAGGTAGLTDQVDRHMGALVSAVTLSTALSVGSELALGGDGRLIDAIRQGSQQSVNRAGDLLVGKQLDVRPSIVVRPGATVRLLVQRDLMLSQWKGNAQ
ncbi:conjugal transfer protein TrbI [Rhizorhabdus dicambivorans]|uniref:Conjugal transfer protein TrbI n=2 Tax=Rhizorhabdus dicambivorans TaxID=1850238 RepID=A0A2A4FPR3_9SPHN|nr:conjugal transfer protein TrbI [Rhizorhabdus dicambivorans]PCE40403.1 conjugal transfer protein TrbI [Rhizorhabdus dicambivorans]